MEKIISKENGKVTKMKFEGDETIIQTEQQVDHTLEYNKRKSNSYEKGSLIGNTQKHQQHIAEIPVTVYYEMLKKLGDPKHNQKAWKKWLNDPDNRFFRTGGGKI